jgi:putative transposase
MKFNPDLHHRQNIRLEDYDYSSNGAYFVTICTAQRLHLFGEIIDLNMQLNDFGQIAQNCWLELPNHFPKLVVDEFVVMPNHVHGVVFIQSEQNDVPVGARRPCPKVRFMVKRHALPLQTQAAFGKLQKGSLGAIVGSFKSAVTKRINEARGRPGEVVWQQNYFDRIVRSDEQLIAARAYVVNNPLGWALDVLNSEVLQ